MVEKRLDHTCHTCSCGNAIIFWSMPGALLVKHDCEGKQLRIVLTYNMKNLFWRYYLVKIVFRKGQAQDM